MRGFYRSVCRPALLVAVVLITLYAHHGTAQSTNTSKSANDTAEIRYCVKKDRIRIYRTKHGLIRRRTSTYITKITRERCTADKDICCGDAGCCSSETIQTAMIVGVVFLVLVILTCVGVGVAVYMYKKKKNQRRSFTGGQPMAFPGGPPMGAPPMGAPPMAYPGGPPMGAPPMPYPGGPPVGGPPMGGPPMGAPPMYPGPPAYPPGPSGYYPPPPPGPVGYTSSAGVTLM